MSASVETNVWGRILHSLKGRLNQQTLDTWFSPIQFESLDSSQHVLRLRAPSEGVKDWVVSNYGKVLAESLNDLRLSGYSVGWVVGQVSDWVPDAVPEEVATSDSLPVVTVSEPSPASPPEPSLSAKYTYESFVVGSCNQFAHAASLAVAEAPGRTYNPLYLYGGVGLGKTHLMHACGHAIKSRNQHLKLCYISSERFMNDLINAIRYDKTQSFREKYRSVDVLLIDDVQFMAGKELPHFQRALRSAEADRDQFRLSAARNTNARGTSALPFRMGFDCRHRASGSRNQDRNPQEKGRSDWGEYS
jgi:chromosomal replication initiator protein